MQALILGIVSSLRQNSTIGEPVGVDACIDPRADASIRPYGLTEGDFMKNKKHSQKELSVPFQGKLKQTLKHTIFN